MPQNLFDDPTFFAGYQKLRASPHSHNPMIESPALRALLGDPRGLRALDLGCGAGELCRWLAERGAASVHGVDISRRMLALARAGNAHPAVRYEEAAMEDLAPPTAAYDLVVSSLAFHYVEDYAGLLVRIHAWLAASGRLVFSMEHPILTCADPVWCLDERGEARHWPVDRYAEEGPRRVTWLVPGVLKHHRRLDTLIGGLLAAGFALEALQEPLPVAPLAELASARRRPPFLLLAARRLDAAGESGATEGRPIPGHRR
jgi:SAM-dependent methyltransferase